MFGYEAVAQILNAEGVETIFTYMAEDNMDFLTHIERTSKYDVDIVHSRHEQGAVSMADGYARSSGEIGFCTVGRGPAVAQSATSLLTARKRGSKVLVLVPETAHSSTYTSRDLDSKEFEQTEFMRITTGDVVAVKTPEMLVEKTMEAFRRLHATGGPVTLQVPRDMLNGELDTSVDADSEDLASFDPEPSRVDPPAEAIDRAVAAYLDSDATKPPVVLAGEGVVRSGAADTVLALADRMDALLATTLQARGLFADHPYCLGFPGDYGRNLANRHLAESDFIYAVGCSLNPHTTDSGHAFAEDATIVHVDADRHAVERYTDVAVGIVGDAERTTRLLLEELAALEIDQEGQFRTDRLAREIADDDPLAFEGGGTATHGMDPRALIDRLRDILPHDRLIVNDGGYCAKWVLDGLEIHEPGDFIWTVDFAAVGQGLANGVGAAVGETSKPTYVFCGDGAVMMAIQELETAVRVDQPLCVFVLNDAALGMEYHHLVTDGKPGGAAVLDMPDLETVAEGLGASGHRVDSLGDLDDLEDWIAGCEDVMLLDCQVDREIRRP